VFKLTTQTLNHTKNPKQKTKPETKNHKQETRNQPHKAMKKTLLLTLLLCLLTPTLWAQISLDATSITNWYGKTRTYKSYGMDPTTSLGATEQAKIEAHRTNTGSNKVFDFSNLATSVQSSSQERYESTISTSLPGASKGISKGATQSYFNESTDANGKKTKTYIYQNITSSSVISRSAYATDPDGAISETDYTTGLTLAVFPSTMGTSYSSQTDILSTTPVVSNVQTNLKHDSVYDSWGTCIYTPLNINTSCIRYKLLITVTIPPVGGFTFPPAQTNAYTYLTKEGITFSIGEVSVTSPTTTTVLSFYIKVPDDFNTNVAPQFSSTSAAPTTATVGQTYTYNIKIDDPDGAPHQGNIQENAPNSVLAVKIAAPTKPAWLTLTDKGDGTATLSGTPAASDVGQHNVTLEATDSKGAKATQSFTITVGAAANQAPTFTSSAVLTAEKDKAYSYTIAANDADGKTGLKITASKLPSWLTLTDKGNGDATLTGTPKDADIGKHDVTLEVTDAQGAKATQSFAITVSGNHAPSAASITAPANNSTVLIGGTTTALATTTTIDITWNASTDADGDAITYTWQLSDQANFSSVLFSQPNGNATTLKLTIGQINSLLTLLLGKGWKEATLYHRVVANDGKNADVTSATASVKLTHGLIVATEGDEIPTKTELVGNYPNPFNPSTDIRYSLAASGNVMLTVYDVQGRLVKTLVDEARTAGSYQVRFEATNLPSGIYFARLQVGAFTQTKPLMLMK
jgi:hypothetical protein